MTYGAGVVWAEEEAAAFASQGIEIEIVDLRTLAPLDLETVLASVKKTSRLIVLHEAPLSGGFGGELTSRITEEAFDYLDAPPLRVASLDTPVPAARNLEREVYSARSRLHDAVRRTLSY